MSTNPRDSTPGTSGDGSSPRRRTSRLEAAGIGAGVGLALTFPAIGAAVLTAGVGAGVVARVLLPFPLLLAALTGGAVGVPSAVLAVGQMPLEGALIGWALAARRPLGAFAVVAAHLLAVALAR